MADIRIIGGKQNSRIVTDIHNVICKQAVELLQDFCCRITGVMLEIVDISDIRQGDIIICSLSAPTSGIKEDGFALSTVDGNINITGVGMGVIYGAVTLLEDYFGVHYFTADTYTLKKSEIMDVPGDIDRLEMPTFRYRQINTYSQVDPVFKLWHRLKIPSEVFIKSMWVHTFNRILPAAEFGDAHPEYYAFINGERRPGTAAQWCLTNPEVFELAAERIANMFDEQPDRQMISISQNDSQNYCQCENCRAIDEAEGSPSGTLVYFMNKLAERFPDKEISTLAYLYSMQPPKKLKPLKNVNIMLCSIDSHREVPLTDNVSGRQFVRAIEGWSAISDNIFVWDYGINFDNYISPFPNFHILQPNMKLFRDNNVTMHFAQINSVKGGDFSELRAYLCAKLMWDVDCDLEYHIQLFLREYYGKNAAPYLREYLKVREDAMLESKKSLWIYDTPITHKDGMLNTEMLSKYNKIFDAAENVETDGVYINRIREARLPVMYAELEISRTMPPHERDEERLAGLLLAFRNCAASSGVMELNERKNTVEEYCEIYRNRYLAASKSIAYGCPVTFITPPDPPYHKIGDTALTDGLYGGGTFNESWVGWVGKDAEFIIDLREEKPVNSIEIDFLHHLGSWILLPKSVECEVSLDGASFVRFGRFDVPEDREAKIKFVNVAIKPEKQVKARYVKVKIATLGLCPTWHYGVGFPAWFFLDEVNIY
ncbi:MAG: DUF4838 domain-containing protein [Defluviitaleaceae bacterium]|nr:DUF4838 domain-containing protein [Defluviitaleaceae bacterium]